MLQCSSGLEGVDHLDGRHIAEVAYVTRCQVCASCQAHSGDLGILQTDGTTALFRLHQDSRRRPSRREVVADDRVPISVEQLIPTRFEYRTAPPAEQPADASLDLRDG